MSTPSRFSRALYWLQSRAGLTGPEARAAVVLVLALAVGLAAQTLRASETPAAPDFYAAADAAFVQAARRDSASAESAPADSTARDPGRTETPEPDSSPRSAADAVVAEAAGPSPASPVSVNTATPAELLALPGVGSVTAGRIAEARPFRDLADLEARVRGIGPAKATRLAPLVRF